MKKLSPIGNQIRTELAAYLKRDPDSITSEQFLREDLGLDSLMTIELLYEIEKTFDFQIPDQDLGGLRTIGDVIGYVEQKLSPKSTAPSRKTHSTSKKQKSAKS